MSQNKNDEKSNDENLEKPLERLMAALKEHREDSDERSVKAVNKLVKNVMGQINLVHSVGDIDIDAVVVIKAKFSGGDVMAVASNYKELEKSVKDLEEAKEQVIKNAKEQEQSQ